jgi:hypothetical protein
LHIVSAAFPGFNPDSEVVKNGGFVEIESCGSLLHLLAVAIR